MWPALTASGSGRERLEQALAGYCEAVEANLELLAALAEADHNAIFHEDGPRGADPPGLHRADPAAAAGRRGRRLAGRRGPRGDRHAAAQPRQLDLPPPAPGPRLGRRARPRRRAAHRAGRGGRAVTLRRSTAAALAVLASGHACADMAQGAVPALLPFLIDQRGISYGAAARSSSSRASARRPSSRSSGWARIAWRCRGSCRSACCWPGWAWRSSGSLELPGDRRGGGDQRLGVAAFHPEGARFADQVWASAAGRDELLLVGRQCRLCARPDPRDPARADLRAARDRAARRPPDDRRRGARPRARPAARGRRREVRAFRARPRPRGSRRGRLERLVRLGGVVALRSCVYSACRPSSRCGSSTTSARATGPARRR